MQSDLQTFGYQGQGPWLLHNNLGHGLEVWLGHEVEAWNAATQQFERDPQSELDRVTVATAEVDGRIWMF